MKKMTLIQRFSIISLIAMILFSLAFGKIVGSSLEQDMLRDFIEVSADIVPQNVIKHFKPADFITSKTGSDYQEFSEEMEHLSLGANIIAIKIWNKDMAVVWSDNKELVEQRSPDNEDLKKAFGGELVSKIRTTGELGHTNEFNRQFENLMELYIPIRFETHGDINAVFEIYQNLDLLYTQISHIKKIVWFWTFLGFSFLYIVLFGIVWNASKRIGAQTKEITETKQDWEDTFDAITDIITIHDKNYNIIKANKTAEKLLKLPDLEKILNIKCYKHYHGREEAPAGCPGCNCLQTGQPCNFELFEPHLNMFIEIRAIPRFDNNNQLIGLIHVVRDITERKRAEETIQLQLKRLNTLRSIEKAITSSLDLRVTLDMLLNQATTQLGIDAAAILLLNQHTQILEYSVSKGFRSSALKYTQLKLGESNAGRAAIEHRIVTIPNLKETPDGFVRSKLFTNEDFITYFAVPLIAKGQVKGILELFHRAPLDTDQGWLEFLETTADQAAMAIDNAALFEGLQRSNIELTLAYDTTIEGWSHALDLRDKETEGHSRRVTDMTLRIARELGIKEEELMHIRRGALLHDIGKMGIPDNILLKPGALTEEEWKIMKLHPVYAYELLYPIEYLRPALDIPYYHHEKWDGTGYPKGLKDKEIPLPARIFALVDVWDALRSDRPYRLAWTKEKVREHIRSLSGIHFDPEVVEVFFNIEW